MTCAEVTQPACSQNQVSNLGFKNSKSGLSTALRGVCVCVFKKKMNTKLGHGDL